MFAQRDNSLVLHLRIETVTPLLIRAGEGSIDAGPDLACVRTRHAGLGDRTVYIPGSSLKGVIRSAAEAFLRSDGGRWHNHPGACNPLGDQSCSSRIKPFGDRGRQSQRMDSAQVHAQHCLACRLFGSTSLKSRTAVRDLFPWQPDASPADRARQAATANRTEVRNGVAIDRLTGGAHGGALYDLEVVPAGVRFYGDIALINYQAWQVGALYQALEEINDGLAQLGSTKSRGLGMARVEVTRLLGEQPLGHGTPQAIGHLRREHGPYGLLPERVLGTAPLQVHGLRDRFDLTDPATIRTWLATGFEALAALRSAA